MKATTRSRPPSRTTLNRRDLATLGLVIGATIAADLVARIWFVDVVDHHPMTLGPIVLQVHRHVGTAFGLTRIAPSALLVVGAVCAAIACIAARHRSMIHATTSTGLIAGGLIAYATDKIPDGAITEFVRVGPLPAAGVSGMAVIAGVIGLALDNWARNDPNSTVADQN